MLADGVIKIGTLAEFRAIELGAARGDPGEGTRSLMHTIKGTQFLSDLQDSPVVKRMFGRNIGTGNALGNLTLQLAEISSDVYMYCTTASPNQEAMEAFESDACIQISNPRAFLAGLTLCLERKGLIAGSGLLEPCRYTSRKSEYARPEATVHPAFLQPTDYSWQKEIRIAWTPRAETIESQLVSCPENTNYLSLYEIS